MKTLVVYDSTFGNTKIIAETIAKELNARILPVSSITDEDLKNIDLIIVGSPIIGWKPSEKMGRFLTTLKNDQLKGMQTAAFDTRVKLFIHGDAATIISEELKRAGAKVIVKPNAFYVKGKEGPLYEGEVIKAMTWAKQIKLKANNN
ncbi:MAG: flavodoxin family protein [Bacillota bacterium]